MTLKEIREEAWAIAREVGTNDSLRLWTASEMNSYINRTYRYIARETRCIRDAHTPAVCRIAYAPPASRAALEALALTDVWAAEDLEEYDKIDSWMSSQLVAPRVMPLHDSIIDIDEVKWKNWPWRLTGVSVTKWQKNPRWEQVIGAPTEYALDYNTNSIALNYRTTNTDTLMLIVRRLPLVPLALDTDIPEFRASYHDYFVNGVLWQMYSKQDAQAFDMKKAEAYEIAFKADVDEIKQQEAILNQKLNVAGPMMAFL